MATGRSMRVSCARYTVAKAPRPNLPLILYLLRNNGRSDIIPSIAPQLGSGLHVLPLHIPVAILPAVRQLPLGRSVAGASGGIGRRARFRVCLLYTSPSPRDGLL